MFVLRKEHEVWWPVVVQVPKDGGEFERQSCRVRFKAQPNKVVQAALRQIARLPDTEQEDAHRELIMDRVIDWTDLVDEDGQPIPFSRETLKAALEFDYVLTAFVGAYAEAFSGAGREKRRRGN
jgi:hypothetical protein